MRQRVSVHDALHAFEFSKKGRQAVSLHEALHDLGDFSKHDEQPPVFSEASPQHFEQALSQHPNIGSIDSDRDYADKKTYLSPDGMVGYAIHSSGELNHVFSRKPGLGAHAVNDALKRGATHLSCFDGKLPEYYKRFGFQEHHRDQNWTPGGPDVVYMKHPGLTKTEIKKVLLDGLQGVLRKSGR